MPTEVTLPNLGDGIDSGDILDVLVKAGDQVAKDQGIIEIETGKATLQVPSTFAGKVTKVHVAAGQTVKPGEVLLTLEAAAKEAVAKAPAAPAAPAAKAAPAAAPPAAPAAKASPKPAPTKPADAKPAEPPPEPAPVATATPADPVAEPTESGGEIAAGPAVRRFAREVGVDLNRVTGSGPGGRISREDVLTVVRQSSQAAGANGAGKASQRDNWGPIHAEKMTKMRKVIAAKMAESGTTVPRVTNFDDADVTELEKIRLTSKEDYAKKGIKLTSLPFVVKAVAMALRSHPTINASLDLESEQIIYKDYVNIGIAVDTDRGLVVPSLRNADELSISDIARGLATISENMREGRINPADLAGSTFSISNLGAIGGTYSTPIINTPEVAILLVGRSRKMPVVVDDQVQIRLMMPLSLSYDHRLVDGGAAARFLNDVIDYLKAPGRLLLAP
ncbi:MAG: 2-oxo acid dehydrogenase subunit E2 [Pirellulaceae bacterium]